MRRILFVMSAAALLLLIVYFFWNNIYLFAIPGLIAYAGFIAWGITEWYWWEHLDD